MNLPFANLFRKPEPHKERRYYAATKAENAVARQRRADIRLELAVYKAVTTPEQRKREADEFFAKAARKAKRKAQRKAAIERAARGRG